MNNAPRTILFLLLTALALAPPLRAETRADVSSLMKQCAAQLRNVQPVKNDFKTPPSCEKVSRELIIESGTAGAPQRIDNSWIADSIDAVKTSFKNDCVPCRQSRRLIQKKKESKQGSKAKKEDTTEDEAAECPLCGDSLLEPVSIGQSLKDLAAAIDYAAALDLKTLPDNFFSTSRARLKTILAGKEYEREKPEPKKKTKETKWTFWENFKKWLYKRIPEIKPRPAPPLPNVPTPKFGISLETIQAIYIGVFALILGLLIVLLILRIRKLSSRGASEEEGAEAAEVKTPSLSQYASEAEQLRRRGEYRNAIRSLFLAFLRVLEQKGLVIFIKNKTNREYLAELRGKKSVGPGVEKLNGLFEEAWYGMKDCDEHDYKQFLEIYESSRREI